MPIKKKNGKWYWGSQGPFDTKNKAEEVADASGYEKKWFNTLKEDEESFDERPKVIEHKGWDTVMQGSSVMRLAENVGLGRGLPNTVMEIAEDMSKGIMESVSEEQHSEALEKLVEILSKMASDAYEEARQAWLRLDPDLKEQISEGIPYDPDEIDGGKGEGMEEIFEEVTKALEKELRKGEEDVFGGINEFISLDPAVKEKLKVSLKEKLPNLYLHSLFAVQTRLEAELEPLMEEERFGEPDVGEIQVDNLPVGQFRDVEDYPETFQEERKGDIARWWGIVKGD